MATSFGASPLQSHRLQDDLHRTWKQRRSAVVFVTHDIDEAVYLDERVVLLSPVQGGISGDIPIRIPRPADRTGSHFLGARREVFSDLGHGLRGRFVQAPFAVR